MSCNSSIQLVLIIELRPNILLQKMKLKHFQSLLQDIETFDAPKISLEQYPTSAHIASRILHTAHSSYDDIEDKLVLDLGCGTAIFAVGAAILGSAHSLGITRMPLPLIVQPSQVLILTKMRFPLPQETSRNSKWKWISCKLM